MFSGPAWIRRRIASASSVVAEYVTSSGPKHCSQTYRASSGYGVRHSLHVRDSGGISDLRVRVGCSEADASPSHISQVALGYLLELAPFPRHERRVTRWLPGLHRASPSTPLDAYCYVSGTGYRR